jgi:hypothetical protein
MHPRGHRHLFLVGRTALARMGSAECCFAGIEKSHDRHPWLVKLLLRDERERPDPVFTGFCYARKLQDPVDDVAVGAALDEHPQPPHSFEPMVMSCRALPPASEARPRTDSLRSPAAPSSSRLAAPSLGRGSLSRALVRATHSQLCTSRDQTSARTKCRTDRTRTDRGENAGSGRRFATRPARLGGGLSAAARAFAAW